MKAADIVDRINYPRRLGGKSKQVSDAIEFYFARTGDAESITELIESRKWWMDRFHSLNEKDGSSSRGWRGI